ncbi:MAG: hypothetical protein AB8B48_15295 [Pseudomonadales bacterium]
MINSAIQSGIAGIRQGVESTHQAANDIVKVTTASKDAEDKGLPDALVSLKQGARQVEASATVVETADETLGTLIDTFS